MSLLKYTQIVAPADMDRSETIQRLEESAKKLRSQFESGVVKRPLIIEFSGLPKAGKTRTISILELFLKRNGFKVDVFIERASIAPIFRSWHIRCADVDALASANRQDYR